MRTLIAGGGTGGHLTPALAVAQELRQADPGGEVLFVSRRGGVGENMITAEGLRLETIAVRGVNSSRPGTIARAVWQLPVAVLRSWRMIRAFRPDVVVGSAGYVCVPVVVAAWLARTPVVMLEQNVIPGKAVRLLARRSRVVAVSFARTTELLPRAHTVVTGNPVRLTVAGSPPNGERCRNILVTGGSQGARRLNKALAGVVRDLLERHPDLSITHQCGAADAEWVVPAAGVLPDGIRERYVAKPFFDDLTDRILAADLVVMRAGGSSLAECSASGRPMVLVPYPYAGGHQIANAEAYVEAGAAIMIRDEECSGVRLQAEIEQLVGDPGRWHSMARASAACGRPDAAARVVDLIREAAA